MPDMQAKGSLEPADSPPVPQPPAAPVATDIDAERRARHTARNEHREARPEGMIPSGHKRLPLEAPLMRVVATGGVVGSGSSLPPS